MPPSVTQTHRLRHLWSFQTAVKQLKALVLRFVQV